MNGKKITGILASLLGMTVFVSSLVIFSFYSVAPQYRCIQGVFEKAFSSLYAEKYFAHLTSPISGILILIFGLISIFWGFLLFPSIKVFMTVTAIFGLFSILVGAGSFTHSSGQSILFNSFSILIFAAGLSYIFASVFLLRSKDFPRKAVLYSSIALLVYLIPLFVFCLLGDPTGLAAFFSYATVAPYIVLSIFFIVFLCHPKIKGHFKS